MLRRFNEKLTKLNEFYDDKNAYLEKRPVINSLDAAISEVKVCEGHKQNFEHSKGRVAELKKLGDEIISLGYKDADTVKGAMAKTDEKWVDLTDKGDKKEAWAKAEKEKQELIEKLKQSLAEKMTELMRWYKDNIEALGDTQFPDGLEEILGFKKDVDAREYDLQISSKSKNDEVEELWKQLGMCAFICMCVCMLWYINALLFTFGFF